MGKYDYDAYMCLKCGTVNFYFKSDKVFECYCKRHQDMQLIKIEEPYENLYKEAAVQNNSAGLKSNGEMMYMAKKEWIEKLVQQKYFTSENNPYYDEDAWYVTQMLQRPSPEKKTTPQRPQKPQKDASVIGRGVAGGLVAGPAGAVIGAVSAIDKNMKNANKKK